ncbi:SMP-30/gluconolactonase/LRE family protein [Jiella sp. M17.18]|uniref:SMP-30/gluconolactonase/LRE family protein n=1 Tax=Jiella sp. M17.18 TaxID=3234247 RepID=UPI0034DE1160
MNDTGNPDAPAKVAVLDAPACRLGEGPTFDAATGTAFWFDIKRKALFEMPRGATTPTIHALPFMASALAVVDRERQLVFAEDGLHLRDAATGRLTLHRPLEADKPQNRCNDARVHPSGAFWLGTMGKAAEREAGAIYWYRAGELRPLYERVGIPNSICFSPDGATGYFTDSQDHRLMRVPLDPATGLPLGDPEVLYDQRGEEGTLDGSVCDADGVIWNARWGAGRLEAYSPQGKRIRSIELPTRLTTCPCFIGDDLGRILVTSASDELSEAELAADPNAGKTFVVDLPVRGRADPLVVL